MNQQQHELAAVEGKIVVAMRRLMDRMAKSEDGRITVSDRRRWTKSQIISGPIAWAAARRLVNNGRALVVRKSMEPISRGPRREGKRFAHELTIARKKPDVI